MQNSQAFLNFISSIVKIRLFKAIAPNNYKNFLSRRMKSAIFLLALFAMSLSQAVQKYDCNKNEDISPEAQLLKTEYTVSLHQGRRLQAMQWTAWGVTGYKAVPSTRRLQAIQPTCQEAPKRRMKLKNKGRFSKRRAQAIHVAPILCPVHSQYKQVCMKC